jgi:hypothetical protein
VEADLGKIPKRGGALSLVCRVPVHCGDDHILLDCVSRSITNDSPFFQPSLPSAAVCPFSYMVFEACGTGGHHKANWSDNGPSSNRPSWHPSDKRLRSSSWEVVYHE